MTRLLDHLRHLHPSNAAAFESRKAFMPGKSDEAASKVLIRGQEQVQEDTGGGSWLVAPNWEEWAKFRDQRDRTPFTPLRDFRKSAARATGVSGFFSGKGRKQGKG